MTYRFGPFTLDPSAYRLVRDGEIIALSPKIIDLLLYLVARPSSLVSKDELFKALWPDVAVTDNALTQAVSELRQALGDDPSEPSYIQTVARRGYSYIAPVNPAEASGANAPQPRAGDRGRNVLTVARGGDRVVGARDHERRPRDQRDCPPQVRIADSRPAACHAVAASREQRAPE